MGTKKISLGVFAQIVTHGILVLRSLPISDGNNRAKARLWSIGCHEEKTRKNLQGWDRLNLVERILNEPFHLFGHRNWILVVDSAYPL